MAWPKSLSRLVVYTHRGLPQASKHPLDRHQTMDFRQRLAGSSSDMLLDRDPKYQPYGHETICPIFLEQEN